MSKPSFHGFANTSPAKPRDPLWDGQRHWQVGWQKKHKAGSQHPGFWLLLCCFRAFWWGPSPSARWGGTVGRRKTDRSYVRTGTAEGERRCSRQRNSVSWEERRTSLFCMSHQIHPLAWGGHVSYGDRGLTPGLCPVPRQRGVEVSWPGWAIIRLTQGLCPSWGWRSEQDGTTETFMPGCTLLEDQTLLR